MSGITRLDWSTFDANDRLQPLRIVTTDTHAMRSVVLGRREGNFHNLTTLLRCLKASMLVPGIAGELVGVTATNRAPFNVREHLQNYNSSNNNSSSNADHYRGANNKVDSGASIDTHDSDYSPYKKAHLSNDDNSNDDISHPVHESSHSHTNRTPTDHSHRRSDLDDNAVRTGPTPSTTTNIPDTITPLVDAFLVEPMPYRSAVREGATHAIVLRTRPDPINMNIPTHKRATGIYENIIANRFFMSNQLQRPRSWLLSLKHQEIYLSDCKLSIELLYIWIDGLHDWMILP